MNNIHSTDLISSFCEYLDAELGRRRGTIRLYRYNLTLLERLFGKPIQEIGAGELRQLKKSRRFKSETTKSIMTAARQFHHWGVLESLWELSPLMLVRTPPIIDSETSPALERHRAAALLATTQTPLEARLVYFGLYLGTRVSESARIDPESWRDDVIRFRGSKNGRIREVPVHPELSRVRGLILAKERCWVDTLAKLKRRLEERVDFSFTPHQLRKCFATTLYDAGVPDEVVADLLGHAGSVTRRYAPVTLKKKREAVALLEYPSTMRERNAASNRR